MSDLPVHPPPRLGTARASLASVDIRPILAIRPYRRPNYEAEEHALALLANELAENPHNMLQKLVDMAIKLCRADTAGIDLIETSDGVEVLRCEALAGVVTDLRNSTLPRKASPCGVCIDRDSTQLMYLPDRRYPAVRSNPRFVETLLIPFHHQGQPIGTVWVAMNQFERKFDREDERVLRTLATFASAGWQLWRAQEKLRSLPALLAQAHETERRALGRELHDDLTQRLAAFGLEITMLSKKVEEAPGPIASLIHNLGQKIGALANDVHRISHQLHPAILENLGLETALREECKGVSMRLHVPVRFTAKNVPRSLPEEIALCFLRVAQESLQNIGKHAGSTEVHVRLTRDKTDLGLFIDDSGIGFDTNRTTGAGGLGLVSMQERLRLINGTFNIRSQRGMGTTVEIHAPLPPKAS